MDFCERNAEQILSIRQKTKETLKNRILLF